MTFQRTKYKDFATLQLKNRWTAPVLMTLITSILIGIFSIPGNLMSLNFSDISAISEMTEPLDILNYMTATRSVKAIVGTYLLSIIQTLVSFIISFASLKLYLKMSFTSEPVSLKTFIEGLSDWARGLGAGLWQTLWVTLWMLICIPVCLLGALLIVALEDTAFSGVAIFLYIILVFASLIPGIYKAVSYTYTPYICAEFTDVSVFDAIKISMKISKGHIWQIIVTDLSFIGWFILGVISLGVGDLWITPYYQMTIVNVYHALLKGALEDGIIKPEDLKKNEERV